MSQAKYLELKRQMSAIEKQISEMQSGSRRIANRQRIRGTVLSAEPEGPNKTQVAIRARDGIKYVWHASCLSGHALLPGTPFEGEVSVRGNEDGAVTVSHVRLTDRYAVKK